MKSLGRPGSLLAQVLIHVLGLIRSHPPLHLRGTDRVLGPALFPRTLAEEPEPRRAERDRQRDGPQRGSVDTAPAGQGESGQDGVRAIHGGVPGHQPPIARIPAQYGQGQDSHRDLPEPEEPRDQSRARRVRIGREAQSLRRDRRSQQGDDANAGASHRQRGADGSHPVEMQARQTVLPAMPGSWVGADAPEGPSSTVTAMSLKWRRSRFRTTVLLPSISGWKTATPSAAPEAGISHNW